ncbi:Glycine oxidase [Bacillus sp. THAF10]|uniref:glycine oxidase ThiO n=1 Tax=Bacillus sp. THAF10 TaxID=2587848 RepID=UPI001268B35C|nr:glycine oxidase ThiO [Bacillus sp. THAF10]QFT88219.1 Glycine oxidase [Bacillus sp. THAF10]
MKTYDVIIVGGGVIGCSAAYFLSRKGYKVLLLEKGKVGDKASKAAAGMLGAQVEVTEEGPLFEMAKESRAMFPSLQYELKEHSGIDFELVQRGMLKLAMNEEEAEKIKNIVKFQQKLGERAEWLTMEQVQARENHLSNSFVGGMDIPSDGHVNPVKLTHAFLQASKVFGAEIMEYVEVISILKQGERVVGLSTSVGDFYGDSVVVAAGAWSKQLIREYETPIDAYPVKGECFSVVTNEPLLESTIFSEQCYLVPKSGNRLIVGATMLPNTFSEHVTLGGISTLMKEAINILPKIKQATFEKAWSGIRPQTGDGLPYLGKHPETKNLIIASGHYRNGILLAPLTGKLVTSMISGDSLPNYIDAFSLDRTLEKDR